jgi:hypothetical protein
MTPRIAPLIVVCPHCQHKYTLGVNGTIDGCDACESVIRNTIDNTIISDGAALPGCWCYERIGDNPDCPEHGKKA